MAENDEFKQLAQKFTYFKIVDFLRDRPYFL